jgi:hypothetical protein
MLRQKRPTKAEVGTTSFGSAVAALADIALFLGLSPTWPPNSSASTAGQQEGRRQGTAASLTPHRDQLASGQRWRAAEHDTGWQSHSKSAGTTSPQTGHAHAAPRAVRVSCADGCPLLARRRASDCLRAWPYLAGRRSHRQRLRSRSRSPADSQRVVVAGSGSAALCRDLGSEPGPGRAELGLAARGVGYEPLQRWDAWVSFRLGTDLHRAGTFPRPAQGPRSTLPRLTARSTSAFAALRARWGAASWVEVCWMVSVGCRWWGWLSWSVVAGRRRRRGRLSWLTGSILSVRVVGGSAGG